MKTPFLIFAILSIFNNELFAQTFIKCSGEKGVEYNLYPEMYISKENKLCFNVTSSIGYKGQNCAVNGGSANWSAIAILLVDGKSLGRDYTDYRVRNATITDVEIDYTIEWRRGADWKPMQHIKIDRLTGSGVSYFMDIQGGDPLSCKGIHKKI